MITARVEEYIKVVLLKLQTQFLCALKFKSLLHILEEKTCIGFFSTLTHSVWDFLW